MDNNNFDGQNDQISEQNTEIIQNTEIMQETENAGFSLKQHGTQPVNNSQPMQNGQVGIGQPMQNQQAGVGQPMNNGMYNSQFNMGAQPGYAQQGMNPQMNYSQPGMSPQMNYSQPGMPMGAGGNGGSGKPPKVKKPLTKGAITAIISGSVALIALIICGVIFLPKIFKPAKDVVVDAFKNTFVTDEDNQYGYIDDVVGYSEIMDTYKEKGGETSATMTINSVAGDDGYNGLSMSFEEKYDPISKIVNYILLGDYKDDNFLTLNLIGTEEFTYIQLLDMIDGYLSLPNENGFIALQESPIGQASQVQNMPEVDIDYFGASDDSEETEIYSGYVSAIEGIWDSVTVEKQGKAKINVNGNTVTTKEYLVSLSEKDIEEAICSALDGASQATLADPQLLEQVGMDEQTFSSSIDQIKSMVPMLVSGDLEIKVYIDGKKVVKITSEDTMSLYGVSLGYDFYLDVDDNNASGALKFTVMDEEVGVKFEANDINGNANGSVAVYMPDMRIDVEFNTTVSETDASYKETCAISAKYNADEVLTGTYDYEFNKTDNTISGLLECNIVEGGVIQASFDGGYKDITKNTGYTFYMDSIKLLVDGENLLDISFEQSIVAGSVSATNYDSSITVYDLTTMTESDFENMVLDNADNIMSWMENILNNTGAFGEDISEMMSSGNDVLNGTDSGFGDSTDDVTIGTEDMILKEGSREVEILGCIDGFTVDYACSYFVDYYTEHYSMIEYTIMDNTTVEDVMKNFRLPSDETKIYVKELNKTIKVGDEDVTYSMVQYDSYGEKASMYMFAKQIADGSYLIVNSFIYDELDSYTAEQLAASLENQYYNVIK